jgi:hypothetical protein
MVADYPPSPPLTPTQSSETKVIERTTHPTGSVIIKVSTTTTRPNGYCEVMIEHFFIPSINAASVRYYTSPDAPAPLPDYRTRVEYHILRPGLELPQDDDGVVVDSDEDDDDVSTVSFTLPNPSNRGVHFEDEELDSPHAQKRSIQRRKRHVAFSILGMICIVVALIIGVAVTRDRRDHSRHLQHDGNVTIHNATSRDDIDNVNRTIAILNESILYHALEE